VEKVTVDENSALDAEFSEKEISSFGVLLLSCSWSGWIFILILSIKSFGIVDLMRLIRGFETGEINVARLNYTIITLLPKE
jgi:hypothetical protein